MDPRHLVQLATILEKGSITQASRHLHLTQPTLTHNMQTLEMQAGGTLFERSRYGVRSTPLGEMLAREGRAIARRLQDAAEVTARHRSGIRHQVRIGAGPLVGAALLSGLAQHLQAAYPDMALLVQSDRPHLLVEQLIDRRHDFVIAPSWLERPPPGIARFLMVEDDLGVYCGRSHPLARQRRLRPGDANGQRWISLGTTSPFDQGVREMLAAAGVEEMRVEITVLGEVFMLLGTLGLGRHLSVLPRFPLRRLGARFDLVELALPVAPTPRHIHLWCHAAALEDPAFAAVKDLLLASAATPDAFTPSQS
ncbi:LysR family transcriptional regulator [Hydrogenophaga sp. OTU3427]|uniref:LysR family transcriptional regulator n=1 Tax=Hydrogenophaga sp. OTU3427 TaxID=3043856 RepID=UPI00313AC194